MSDQYIDYIHTGEHNDSTGWYYAAYAGQTDNSNFLYNRKTLNNNIYVGKSTIGLHKSSDNNIGLNIPQNYFLMEINLIDNNNTIKFYGNGIKKGATAVRTEIPDIAPTIAVLLGMAFPNGTTGRPIAEVLD